MSDTKVEKPLTKVAFLIDEATFLPTVCINIVIDYYDIRAVVKQITENYLPQILDTELINDLNMDRVIDRAVPVFERAIETIRQADMKSKPWVCNDEGDFDEIIYLVIGHGAHTGQFMDLYPTMSNFLSFAQHNISGHLDFTSNTPISDKFFRELILFAGGKEFTRIPIVVVDL